MSPHPLHGEPPVTETEASEAFAIRMGWKTFILAVLAAGSYILSVELRFRDNLPARVSKIEDSVAPLVTEYLVEQELARRGLAVAKTSPMTAAPAAEVSAVRAEKNREFRDAVKQAK